MLEAGDVGEVVVVIGVEVPVVVVVGVVWWW